MNTENCVVTAILSGIAILIIFVIVIVVRDLNIQRQCLLAGYANHSTTWNLQGFCIREENEWEITVPLRDILNN